MAELKGKVAFITGAARGQGRSHAVTLAKAGADIVAVDINKDIDETVPYQLGRQGDLAETERLVRETGQRILGRTADVRSPAELDKVVAEALSEFGHIDVVCANAGILTTMRKTWELSEAEWQDVIDVNLTGVFNTVKAVVPSMVSAKRGGSIVLTSSLGGLKGYANMAGYVAAKHGVNGLMRTLANELGPENIRVNSVCPGLVNTDMLMNQAIYDVFRPDIANPTRNNATEAFRAMQVLPVDHVEPRDVSEIVAWLGSDASRFVTGVAVPVDGGQLGR
ncbi:mycofactocin-coupled SDR family oxidoreductase [Amycolatopsis sp. GM8]|uniref:mycofactocin-coupled SDR family oxidoreductase n=1 Tax=Amycolatopsis sp. GM8 TaxID=2896530 RepID=UPI001F413EF5|nr:mycofactocin-coupled SDR family oxidoreductase [Amycolatopsis sp. GM8]